MCYLKVKGWKNIYCENINRKGRVSVLISVKVDLRRKEISVDKEEYYIIIKGSILYEDLAT